jgi:hypothetical protein
MKDDDQVRRRWGDEPSTGAPKEENSTRIDELLRRAEPMIAQLNTLYTMFITGVERLPPLEKRKQLEQIMATLQSTPKPNATYGFRVNTLNTHFLTMRERWDKQIRDVESGKIKRTAGPKRGT